MKTKQILKAIAFGAVAGAAIFFIPFPFRIFFIFFLIFFAFRFFAHNRFRNANWNRNSAYNLWNPSYTQRWQSMSDEERKAFIKKMKSELFATQTVTE